MRTLDEILSRPNSEAQYASTASGGTVRTNTWFMLPPKEELDFLTAALLMVGCVYTDEKNVVDSVNSVRPVLLYMSDRMDKFGVNQPECRRILGLPPL